MSNVAERWFTEFVYCYRSRKATSSNACWFALACNRCDTIVACARGCAVIRVNAAFKFSRLVKNLDVYYIVVYNNEITDTRDPTAIRKGIPFDRRDG